MITHKNRVYLTIEELSRHLPEKPTLSAIYSWTHKNKIPYVRYGRKIYFDREQIDQWNDSGRPSND
jgi:excisionase family DNA binding protein